LGKLKPEKITEADVLAMCSQLGLDVAVIDSKAIYSKNKEKYVKNYCVPEGSPDIWGSTPDGFAVYLELKAKGKLHTVTPAQRQFLLRKAQAGCFAAAVDSADLLFDLYCQWKTNGASVLLALLSNTQE
jgi:selenophosphate synthase